MKFQPLKRAPLLLTGAVLALVCGLQLAEPDFVERLERITYDLRARAALHFPAPVATNLAFAAITEDTLRAVKDGSVGFHFGLLWPREVYGRIVNELSEQGAQAVAFDVLFSDLRADHPPVQMADGHLMESDEYFAWQMRRAGNVILADTSDAPLPELFVTNALALGDITTEKDSDGVLRRVRAFRDYRRWHPLFYRAAEEFNLDLARARIEPGQIVLPQFGTTNTVVVPVDAENDFALTNFIGAPLPPRWPPTARAFTVQRVWQMGIVLAAQALKLDLSNAVVDLPDGKITLRGPHGVKRVIPVDRDGYFYVNWQLRPNDPHLFQAPVESLLAQNFRRLNGQTNGLSNAFGGKLVVVGSAAQGNDLADRGATPLDRDTLLVSKHWNVANSILTGAFIRRASPPLALAIILVLGVVTALLTWHGRALAAAFGVLLLMALYIGLSFFVFIRFRFWLPLVVPLGGAVLLEHLVLTLWRVVFEEGEKRRVKSVFSRIVSPDVVHELLQLEKLSLGGARQEVTVWFADVRGFTQFTDQSHARAMDYILRHKLSAAEAEAVISEEARETLQTINQYLSAVAEAVKKHGGTLDKYIGDCAMAFWNAPVPHPGHAAAAVRAAIDAQRAIYALNLQRVEENQKRELQNALAGAAPKPRLPILMLGSGINTGMATVGLMGSDEHLLNYTVFGREVNLASRLESVSGSARILISEETYNHLCRDDPALAATCLALPPVKLKGFVGEVKIYEVPWRPPGASPFDEELFSPPSAEGTTFTGIVQRENR
ncbi:MAG TPA: adenylate/guanylate cyclase domain-containing protein [Verrucomicrobiae bacterium]|nr:adenylate/guanylate cyclase domain-containing protein [Verrucomicrobiae bacterium]